MTITHLIHLRVIVGYLGEKEQNHWWPSSFFSASSDAFLTPIFSRTQSLAQLSGVSRAASRIHDEYIGVGAVYHLFRLPERLEQRIVTHMQQTPDSLNVPTAKDEAIVWLREFADTAITPANGPVRIGSIQQIQDEASWKTAVAHYLQAFETGERIYPYFRDTAT